MPSAETRVREMNRGYGAADAHLPRPAGGKPRHHEEGPSYYDISMLKPPVWKWEIAGYFFFGGLSAGAYLLARLAERFGGRRMKGVRTAGSAIAAVASVPCAPLLIKDLGDMSRFHHMLRVFKPRSPMSLGAWVLTGYSGAAVLALLRELAGGAPDAGRALPAPLERNLPAPLRHRLPAPLGPPPRRTALALRRADPVIVAVLDGAGIPAALLMASYGGVLLSCTATPVWSRNAWLAPLFAASSMSTAAASIKLGLALQGREPVKALEHVDRAARLAEAGTLAGYLASAGERAQPLTGGKMSHHTWIAVGALILPELIQHALPGRPSRWKTMLAAGATLIGGLSLRWAIVQAGHESANDPEAARQVSQRQDSSRGASGDEYD